jgi:hypothetical protein
MEWELTKRQLLSDLGYTPILDSLSDGLVVFDKVGCCFCCCCCCCVVVAAVVVAAAVVALAFGFRIVLAFCSRGFWF